MKQVAISVPDMQSTHCQTRVSNTVKEVKDVQIQNVEAGKLMVFVTSDNTIDEVIQAVEKEGYTVSLLGDSNSSACTTGCCSN